MGEFDLSLIREFRNRPAFYDRNSPLFKDKVHTAHEWQEISNKLGFDVSLLKDRMLQLRNRYNLEKRRLEQLRLENPGKLLESPWPLYEHLHFLSDHIRARRSYKRMLPLQASAEEIVTKLHAAPTDLSNSASNPSSYGTTNSTNNPATPCQAAAATFADGLLTVKMEEDNDSNDAETESQTESEEASSGNVAAPVLALPTLQPQNNVMGAPHSISARLAAPISCRRLDTLRITANANVKLAPTAQKRFSTAAGSNNPSAILPAATHQYRQQKLQQAQQRIDNEATHADDPLDNGNDVMHLAKKPRISNLREQKYAAFGNFMSSSLVELPPKKALLLVEKFTSELVKVLIQRNAAGISCVGGDDAIATDALAINGQQ